MIDKIAALVPPPNWHLHRYYGVLAPNSHLRSAVTALAPDAVEAFTPEVSNTEKSQYRPPSHYLWSELLARIYNITPLICPNCHADMQTIAFITEASTIQKILRHIGEPTQPPTTSSARSPPWDVEGASEQVYSDPQWDMDTQAEPEFQYDQRLDW
jgi:Putative transposase